MLKAKLYKHTLRFKTPGGTSRGVLETKDSWFMKVFQDTKPDVFGLGEAGIIPKLSIDDRPELEEKLKWCVDNIDQCLRWNENEFCEFPSIKFALETAILDLYNGGKRILFQTEFTHGETGIPINGLIWMGSHEFMKQQIIEKIEHGFRCIKLKIGSIDFDKELSLIKMIRDAFNENVLELRVDANGAFHPDEALEKLKRLSEYHIHSIEQPIRQHQWEKMAELTSKTPVPIVLDEELIGIAREDIPKMLDAISPQYIILKPGLIGGFKISEIFIMEAEKRNIGWWGTSALESNIGLNAIAQWISSLNNILPQGLGTGQVFSNNIDSPLFIENAKLYFDNKNNWQFQDIIHD